MDSILTYNQLDVCVLAHGLDKCPGPLSSFESIVL